MYQNIEELLIKVCQGKACDDELTFVCTFYKEDLDHSSPTTFVTFYGE